MVNCAKANTLVTMCIVHVNGVYWKYYIITMQIFYIDLQIFSVQYEPLIVEIETNNKSYWRKTVHLKTYYSNNDIYVFSSYYRVLATFVF